MNRSLSILTYSSLYPNCVQQRHGIFVEQRLLHLLRDFPVTSRVVAPVPWFPFKGKRFGAYGTLAEVPARETRGGVDVYHPRYGVIPALSWRFSPLLMAAGTIGLLRRLHAAQPFDLIDAHFVYPDGAAASLLGRALGVPVAITARGSDLSLMPRYALPRRFIRQAGARADALITVCNALKDAWLELGVTEDKIHVLRNGVDLQKFSPVSGHELRERLGVGARRMLLSVGNLVELKGNHLTIAALAHLPDIVLVLVGEGPEEASLRKLAQQHGVAARVVFVGTVPQLALREYYSAADALVLASSREGWANVLLEAMACGTPVIASKVWGTPEVVAAPAAGVLLDERSPLGIVRAYQALFANLPSRAETRAYAAGFSWDETSRGQYELFQRMLRSV